MLFISLALAAPVHWDSLNEHALNAFDGGPGASYGAKIRASEQAARAVPIGPTSVVVDAQMGLAAQRQLLTGVEIPLGLGLRERRMWRAEAASLRAEADRARWEWGLQIHERWFEWWLATEIHEHLQAYADEVDRQLERFEEAERSGLIASLTLDELRAELLQVRREAIEHEQRATILGAELRTLLDVEVLDDGDHAIHARRYGPNPWSALLTTVERDPAIRAAAARRDAARHRARATLDAHTPTVVAGPMWAPDEDGVLARFAYVGVTVPLQPGLAPERRAARGEEAAAEADRRWRLRQRRAYLERELGDYDATLQRLRQIEENLLGPLQARQERLEAALEDGLVRVDRVILARRQRHEAEHEQLRLVGELLASEARAQLLSTLMGDTP